MGLGEGEGDTVQVRGREKDGGRVRVSTGVTAGCRSTAPRPIRCPLTSVLTLGPASSPVPPRIPSDSTQQGTVRPVRGSPGPGVARAGDSGTHLAGAAVAGRVRAQRPRRGAGLAGRDGAARPSEAEGGLELLSGSLDVESTTEKGKK